MITIAGSEMPTDRRHFKRYPRKSELDPKLNKNSHKIQIVDYSLGGIGAVIGDSLGIAKGDIISIDMEDLEMKTFGQVVWLSGRRIGIKNIGQLKGRVSDFRISDVLIGLQRTSKTGIFTVQNGSIVRTVFVRGGDMVFAASNQEEERLGDMLLREGKITRAQYDHAVIEMKRTKQRQGAVLVRLGYLKPQQLPVEVKHQVEEIIKKLITLQDGSFSLEEMPLPTEEVITLKLSVANLIYHGLRTMDLGRVENELPTMEDILCFSPDPLNLFQDIQLDYSGKKIISCIDGKTPIREIVSITQLDSREVSRTIYALLSTRMIEINKKIGCDVAIPEEVTEEIIEEKTEQKPKPEINPELKDMIEDMHQRCGSLGYYGILGVKEHAPLEDMKSAYYKAAKQFHPDRHFHLIDDSLKDKLSDIFSYIYEAYTTLRNEEKKKEYDRMMILRPARLTSTQDRAKAVFEEGRLEFKKGNYAGARLLFGQAVYFDATTADYHYYHGLALMKEDRPKDAEKAMTRALKLAPGHASYLAELGFIFLALGFRTRAKAFFEKSLKTEMDNVRAREGLLILSKA